MSGAAYGHRKLSDYPLDEAVVEAGKRCDRLRADILDLETKIAEPAPCSGSSGRRLTPAEAEARRESLGLAVRRRRRDLHRLEHWLKKCEQVAQARLADPEESVDPESAASLLRAAYRLLVDLVEAGVVLDERGQALLGLMRHHLQRNPG